MQLWTCSVNARMKLNESTHVGTMWCWWLLYHCVCTQAKVQYTFYIRSIPYHDVFCSCTVLYVYIWYYWSQCPVLFTKFCMCVCVWLYDQQMCCHPCWPPLEYGSLNNIMKYVWFHVEVWNRPVSRKPHTTYKCVTTPYFIHP